MGWSPFRKTGLTHRDDRSFEGLTLITPIGGHRVYLLSEGGFVVHYWEAPNFQPGYGYLLPGGSLLVRGQPMVESETGLAEPVGEADIILELDWDGNEVWRFEHESLHHDMCRLPNGNTLVLIWEILPDDLKNRLKGGLPRDTMDHVRADQDLFQFMLGGVGVGGRPRHMKPTQDGFFETVLVDAIWEVDPEGEPVKIWHAYDYLDPETDTLCPFEWPLEWTHANAVEALPDGRGLVSFRELSTVVIINWESGELDWKWGRNTISHQHNPTMTPEGNILIFDNGTHHPIQGRTRVIEVNPETNSLVWQYTPSPVFSFMCGHIGGCERLPNGNTLICEGESGRIFEVTPELEFCWEWVSPFVHDFKGVQNVQIFRAHRYSAHGPELEGKALNKSGCEEINREWKLIS